MTVFSPSRPPDREELQALIEEARQRARRRRRRQIKIVLAALILIAAAMGVAVGRGGSGRSAAGSSGARAGDAGASRAGDYWYTRTIVAANQPVIGIAVPAAGETIETWIGADGTWRQRAIEPSDLSLSSDMIIGGDGPVPAAGQRHLERGRDDDQRP